MPVFTYSARDYQGGFHKGEVETTDEHQAATILRRKKLIVISIKSKNESEQKIWDSVFSRVSFNDVVIMTRQLAIMIESGLVLSEALDILEEEQSNRRLKKVIKEISDDIKGGLDFASAIEKHPDIFPGVYAKLVRAGEASGQLHTILLELASSLEKQMSFNSKVKGAMIYPIVVLSMMGVVMLIMVFFVMPKLTELYKQSNIELPLPTKIVLGFTNFMLQFWWAVALAIVAGVIMLRRYLKSPEGKYAFDRLILKVPVAGRIVTLVVLTNFTRTFGLLISAGISVLESIKIASDVVDNMVFKNSLEIAGRGVERGLPFSSQLLGLSVFPKIIGQMARTGEETGKLDDIMGKVSEYFESEADTALKSITTLIEPIVLVILGIGVGFLVVSIILPIYQLTTSIK